MTSSSKWPVKTVTAILQHFQVDSLRHSFRPSWSPFFQVPCLLPHLLFHDFSFPPRDGSNPKNFHITLPLDVPIYLFLDPVHFFSSLLLYWMSIADFSDVNSSTAALRSDTFSHLKKKSLVELCLFMKLGFIPLYCIILIGVPVRSITCTASLKHLLLTSSLSLHLPPYSLFSFSAKSLSLSPILLLFYVSTQQSSFHTHSSVEKVLVMVTTDLSLYC